MDICDEVVNVLRQYMIVSKVDEQVQVAESQPMEQDIPVQCLSGQVSQAEVAQVK